MIKYILLFLISFSANAAELGVMVASKHIGGGHYNETNPGLYVKSSGYMAGTYLNSYSDQAYMVGKVAQWNHFSITYGLVKGYAWDGGFIKGNNVLPFVLPSAHFGPVNIHLLGNAVAVSFSIKL